MRANIQSTRAATFLATCGLAASLTGCSGTGESAGALTAEQCSYFGVNDKVTVCHKTGSAKKPYTIIRVNVAGCASGHAGHDGDYVAYNDPTCNGSGCFPEGAPFDGTVECCEGLVVRDGKCTDLCAGVDCDDGNGCTDDSCNPASGCTHTNNTAGCSDGNACTTNDACSAGTCVGGAAPSCDDGNGCTDDSCNPASGCAHTNNTAGCNDGNPCTTNDACSAGACVGGAAPSCDDGNGCTDDSCNPASGCAHTNNTAGCNDGNACTTNDACSAGACVGGAAPSCDDGNGCTDDSCNPASGCAHTNNTAGCNDGNPCTQTDTCQAGICTGSGTPATPSPLHRWTFNDGTATDSVTGDVGTLNGASISSGELVVDNSGIVQGGGTNNGGAGGQWMKAAVPGPVSQRTLVSWVSLPNLNQPGGGNALTIENGTGDVFDAIVYGERAAGQWMSGSDNWARTPANNGGAAETSTGKVMMAIVYGADNSIAIYRNGAFYAGYTQGTLQTYNAGAATIGKRHSACNIDCWLTGRIDEARIYGAALCPAQIAALTPVPSPPAATGCSDGTREGFVNEATYPGIAACSGGWSIPGVKNTIPACNRVSGNSSANTSGTGCNVADLCASGWHVCNNATEVAAKGTSCSDAMVNGAFFIQRQASYGYYACFDAADAENDIWGCAGTSPLMSGLTPNYPCGVLNANSGDGCGAMPAPWNCNVGGLSSSYEAAKVTKSGSANGGVLCCKD